MLFPQINKTVLLNCLLSRFVFLGLVNITEKSFTVAGMSHSPEIADHEENPEVFLEYTEWQILTVSSNALMIFKERVHQVKLRYSLSVYSQKKW